MKARVLRILLSSLTSLALLAPFALGGTQASPQASAGLASVAPPPLAPDSIKGGVPIVLYASRGVAPFHVAPRASLAPYRAQSAMFIINYIPAGTQNALGDNCLSWPAGSQAAFTYAANLWSTLLNSSVPIKIDACWASLGEGVLGYSKTDNFYRNFTGAPQSNTWYSVALANALSGTDQNGSDPEMHIAYSDNGISWYFGTDGHPPMGTYDFVSVVMHEIAHGLNFAGSMQVTDGQGSWGFSGYPNVPVIYDRFAENDSAQSLTNTTLFPNPSATLAAQLTGDNLYFNGPNAKAANGGSRPKLYAPGTWKQGSSYAHLDYDTFKNTVNALMLPVLDDGAAIHDPGPVTCGIFRDLGWQNPCPTVAIDEGVDNASLTWTTGGDAEWFGQTSVYYYGSDAAQSGDMPSGTNRSSWIQTTITGPGIISFYWKVSSPSATAGLMFYMDGVERLRCWTYESWESQTYSIPSGSHSLTWNYAPAIHLGAEAGFLDKVVFTSGSAIMVQAPNGGEAWYHRYPYTIKWASTEDVGPDVKIELYKGENLYQTISADTDNNGSYDWFIVTWIEPSTDYRIRITSNSHPTVYDYSDGYFTIKSFLSSFGGFLVLPYTNPPSVYANADDHSELDVTGSLTIEAWVYYEGDYWSFQGIVNKFKTYMLSLGYSGSARCIGFLLWPASGSSGGADHCRSPPPYYSGWHHVAGVFRTDTDEIRTCLDGTLYSGPYSFTNTIKNSSDILQVGYQLFGKIDELRISDMARYTGSTYTVPTSTFTCDANTRALWHFDEPQGATVFHDACGTDNVLVGYGGAHTEGVIEVSLNAVTITGPTTGVTNTAYTFSATVSPISATTPITFTWAPVPNSGQNTGVAVYTWPTAGIKTIMVTATNAGGSVTGTHAIAIGTLPPTLAVNYSTGKPGSFFTFTGTNFPPNSTATIAVNGHTLTNTVTIDSSGNLVFLLDTSQASPGHYFATATVNPSATQHFTLDPNAPLHSQEGNGTIISVPSGIALDKVVYLPLVVRQ